MIYKMLITFTLLLGLAESVVYLTWRQFDKPKGIGFYNVWINKDHLKLLAGLFIAGLLICVFI